MELSELAKKFYLEGYSCSESILHALKEAKVIDIPGEVLKAISGFRQGIGGRGCLCGVVAGSTIAVGLLYGRTSKQESEEIALKKSALIHDKFKEKFNSTCCRVLTRKWKDNFSSKERKEFCTSLVQWMITELKSIL